MIPPRGTLRGRVQRLHRWLGLTLGLWFAVLGLSGSVLVFWHGLEDLAYPRITLPADGPPHGPAPALQAPALQAPALQAPALQAPALQAPALQALALEAPALQALALEAPALQALALEAPALQAPALQAPALQAPALQALALEALVRRLAEARPGADIYRIHLPAAPGAPVRLDFLMPLPGSEDPLRGAAHLHPVTGDMLSERIFGEAWIHTLYSLHSGSILGRPGIVLAALVGLGLGVLALLGLFGWFHRDGRPWRESLAPMRGFRGLRRLRNWHRSMGAWAALPLLLAALTGAGLAFPDTLRAALRPVLAEPEPQRRPGPADPGLAAAMAQAEALLPGFRTIWIDLPPAGSKAPTALVLRPADGSLSGPAIVETSPALGKMMLVTQASPVETLRAWIMALHNGQALGLGHRLFVVALGLAPAALGLLGWRAWRRRARARQGAGQPAWSQGPPARG